MVRLRLPLSTLLAAAISSCAPNGSTPVADARAGHDCFDVNLITGYDTIDKDTILVRTGVDDEYQIDLKGGQCDMLEWTHALAIESTPSSWICTGKDPAQGNIYFRDPATRRRVQCYIEEVRRAPAKTKTSESNLSRQPRAS